MPSTTMVRLLLRLPMLNTLLPQSEGIAYLDGTYYVMNPNGQIFGSDSTVQLPGLLLI